MPMAEHEFWPAAGYGDFTKNPARLQPELRDYPIYLGLAMDGDYRLRLKPQNLLLNLPLTTS